MKYLDLVKKYRFDIVWILVTLSIILLINIAYMYSRDVTLSTGKWTNFKVFTKLMDNVPLNNERFLEISNAYSPSVGCTFNLEMFSNVGKSCAIGIPVINLNHYIITSRVKNG